MLTKGNLHVWRIRLSRNSVNTAVTLIITLIFLGCGAITDNLAPSKATPDEFAITTSNLPDARVGANYSEVVRGAGGMGTFTWSLDAVSEIPSGINFIQESNSSGKFLGTPLTAGDYAVIVNVYNSLSSALVAQKVFSIKVQPRTIGSGKIKISYPLLFATVGVPFSEKQFVATGGKAPYAWSLSNNPDWMSIDAVSGKLSGKAPIGTLEGDYVFSVQVVDSGSPGDSSEVDDVPMTLFANYNFMFTSDPNLPEATEGEFYSFTFEAINADREFFCWHAPVAGVLPNGLFLNVPTKPQSIEGTIEFGQAGSWTFDVLIEDWSGNHAQQTFTLVVNPGTVLPLAITAPTATFPYAVEGQTYSNLSLGARGGVAPYTWSLGPGAPDWIAVSGSTLFALHKPSANDVGNSTFAVTVEDSNPYGHASTSLSVSLEVYAANALRIAPSQLNAAMVGLTYTVSLSAIGGASGYAWSLPNGHAWLSLSTVGTLSGTPTIANVGNGSVTIEVSDSLGAVSRVSLAIEVQTYNDMQLTVNSQIELHVGDASFEFDGYSVTGGSSANNHMWELHDAPSWLGVVPQLAYIGGVTYTTAKITNAKPYGLPEMFLPAHSMGTYTFSVVVTDAGTQSQVSALVTLTVLPEGGPVRSDFAVLTSTVYAGELFEATLTPRGGSSEYRSIGIDSQPPWLHFETIAPLGASWVEGIHIYGIPSSAGPFTFAAHVTDSDNNVGDTTYIVDVQPEPSTGTIIRLGEHFFDFGYSRPMGIDFDSSGRYAFIAEGHAAGHGVVRMDLQTGEMKTLLPTAVNGMPEDLCLRKSDGTLFVATFDKGLLKVANALNMPIATTDITKFAIPGPWPTECVLDKNGENIFVLSFDRGSNYLFKLSTVDGHKVDDTFVPNVMPQGLALRNDDLYVANAGNYDSSVTTFTSHGLIRQFVNGSLSNPGQVYDPGLFYPGPMDFDANGNLYVGECTADYALPNAGALMCIRANGLGNISSTSAVEKVCDLMFQPLECEVKVHPDGSVYIGTPNDGLCKVVIR